jgi:small subunit ribosomal protein S1
MECFSICTGKGDKRIVRSHTATFKGEAKPAKKEVKKKTESSSAPAEKSTLGDLAASN